MEQSPEFCDKHLESGTSKNLPDFSLGRINLFHQKKTLELMECCNHIKKILSIFNTFVFILCIYMKPLLYISKNSGTAKCIVWRRSSGWHVLGQGVYGIFTNCFKTQFLYPKQLWSKTKLIIFCVTKENMTKSRLVHVITSVFFTYFLLFILLYLFLSKILTFWYRCRGS